MEAHFNDNAAYFDNNNTFPMYSFTGYFIEKRTVLVDKEGKFRMFIEGDFDKGYGYSNIRFKGENLSKIECISLDIGGQSVDRIYPSLKQQYQFENFKHTALPSHKYHDMWAKVQLKYKSKSKKHINLEMEYDVVKITNPIPFEDIGKKVIYLEYPTYKKINLPKNNLTKHKIELNFAVNKIEIYTKLKIKNLNLKLDTFDVPIPPFSTTRKNVYKYKYEFIFENPLYLSRCNEQFIEFDKPTDMIVISHYLTYLKTNLEMAGLHYSA
jgi:hypothetical protein